MKASFKAKGLDSSRPILEMKKRNCLIIMSGEHSREAMGVSMLGETDKEVNRWFGKVIRIMKSNAI